MADNSINELDVFFPRLDPATQKLGMVISGSLSKGLEVKLDPGAAIEDIAVGRYVIAEGAKHRFFGMITDVVLDNTNPQIEKTPPDVNDPFLREIHAGIFLVFLCFQCCHLEQSCPSVARWRLFKGPFLENPLQRHISPAFFTRKHFK